MADYSISVRSLCEFTAKSGDLSVRFTPTPTAQQGIAGHLLAASRRGPHYIRELSLRGHYENLAIRGRADGYDPDDNRLEEFKTFRGDLTRMPANQRGLHWAQLKFYGAMLCADRQLAEIRLALVYVDIDTEQETALTETLPAADLRRHFEDHCSRFLTWAICELAHRRRRDSFLASLDFPHEQLREGQRTMAEAAYRAAMAGVTLMIQAPTGIGKTIGTLFPVLKAVPRRSFDRVFFLVAKTPGRALALEAIRQLTRKVAAAPLRTLELLSKESSCEYPGRSCDAAHCPLACGFYDRLPAAREDALQGSSPRSAVLDRASVRHVALEHSVCPYYLTQELARWCDVVVGDYHYFFDRRALLHALAIENDWRTAVLVDEAHNLVPRAREMYSATLMPSCWQAAFDTASPTVQRALRDVQRSWHAIHRVQTQDYAVHEEIPASFLSALQGAITLIGDESAADAGSVHEMLLRFYFDALHFCRMAEDFGSHSLFDVSQSGADSTLCIRNVDPGPFLRPRWSGCVTAVVFSATFAPPAFYRQLMGLPDGTRWIDVGSTFTEDQLEVRIESGISTRFHDREDSVDPIVAVMERQYRARRGNYLAYFSSFVYLQMVLRRFRARFPEIVVWEQTRGMTRNEREAFLARFASCRGGIGFAVLGGAFAEGVDLPGEQLIGAFVATLGLPQVNEVNAEMARRLEILFGAGDDYTYLYPGLQKVVQAAGRVIRTSSDRGTLHLMDDRYRGARVRALLPHWWRVQCS